MLTAPGPSFLRAVCDNTCNFAGDGQCDDGGLGSAHPFCQLGTDCDDCGVRTVARLPVRELGYEEHAARQPSIGLGEEGATNFVMSASFEECAALCGDDCIAIVRRNSGSNCWLVPAASYPGDNLISNLDSWSGGTTYVKLQECEEADVPRSCEQIWGVPCTCEDYTVQNTFIHPLNADGSVPDGAYEYATLDDAEAQPEQCVPRWDPADAGACSAAITVGQDDPALACTSVGVDDTCQSDRCQKCAYTAQASTTTYSGRCPNDQPNCAGSTCANGLSGQNYFLRLPCGWDFFKLFTEPEPGSDMEPDDFEVWENVVTLGWGTSCVNDVFSGAALWTNGPNAGYDDSAAGGDYQCATGSNADCQIMNECGQMHPAPEYNPATQSYRSWYTEFSPVAGIRSLSCGRRFLIRRPVSCIQPVDATSAATSDCADISDVDMADFTSTDPVASRRVGSCNALTTVLLNSGDSCDVMSGPPNGRQSIWDVCCVTCERRFGVRPDRQVAQTSISHGLQLDPDESVGVAQEGNWAVGTGTVVIPQSSQAGINDGNYGNAYAWSGGQSTASGSGATISVGYAFTNDYAESSMVLVDAIAFGRDNSQANSYHNNYAGAYTIQISQYSVDVPGGGDNTPGTFEQAFTGGIHDAEACVQPVVDQVPVETTIVCADVAIGTRDSQRLCENSAAGEPTGCEYRGQWETLDTLLYDEDSPDHQPWKRHYYRLTPPVPATAIRIVTSSPSIVIDEFEVYGASPMSPDWVPDEWDDNRLLPAPDAERVGPGVVVTDSTHAENAIQLLNIQRPDGSPENSELTEFSYPTCLGLDATPLDPRPDDCVANWPSKGAEVVAEFDQMQIIYEVAFRSASETSQITACKISFIDRFGIQQFVTAGSVSTNPEDAVDILEGVLLTDYAKDGGHTVPLSVPIETHHVRFYAIDGNSAGEEVQVQFGLSGKPADNVEIQTNEPQLDVDISAQGFDATVGCDEVTYEVTVRHKRGSAGGAATNLRLTDMLSDSKLRLIPGAITVEKQMEIEAEWTLMDEAAGGYTVISGNDADSADSVVMVDVRQLFNGQVLRLSYTVRVLEPEPLDIISSMAVVELLSLEQTSQCRDGGLDAAAADPADLGPLLSKERLIARHTLESDVGTLSFDASVSYGDSTIPYEVTIDGRADSVFMINLDIAVLLSAGTAKNVLLRLEIPDDRQQYFELLSVDSLDNTGSRSATSDDEAVLLMGEFSVLTESITVPCSTDGSDNSAGLELALTGALYNSFYYSPDYSCQLAGCNELSLRAVLEYDLVSDTIFHDRFSDERLFNTTRGRGASLPAASIEDLGVHYSGGHPTWPLFTVQLDNKEMPTQNGEGGSSYEGKISIEGSFEGMDGRLSVIVSGGVDEFYITRNQLRDVPGESSFGTIGRIVSTEKVSSDGDDWDLSQIITSSDIELRIKVTDEATFLTGTIDGHVVTTVYNDANILLGDSITISVFKELETDDVIIRSVDASFVCIGDCTVRHTEAHDIEVARPGAPPNDIMLTSIIQTGQCGDTEQFGYDACVTERAVEGTAVASISVTDADWSIGDTYRYEIVDQSGGSTFRLSSDLASRNDEVLLEVATASIPEFYDQQELTVLLTVRDNLWFDHFFTKLVTIRVLAYPMKVDLSPSINTDSAYVVPELAPGGTKLADIGVDDPDATQASTVTFALSGDDAGLFDVQGAELLVADGVPLPSLVDQSFFDIVITATDWNGLEYPEIIELTSTDFDECDAEGDDAACSATAACLNSVGSYQCLCPDGSVSALGDTGAVNCEEILECAIDNGSCGDTALVTCEERTFDAAPASCIATETSTDPPLCATLTDDPDTCETQGCIFTPAMDAGFGFECVDIDECDPDGSLPLGPNGACGDASHVRCQNEHAEQPTCEDICECPDACAEGAFCTDLDQQSSACATPSWDGEINEVEASSDPVSIVITNNADLGSIETYALMTSSTSTNVQQSPLPWTPIVVDVADEPAGCDAATDPACTVTVSFTPTNIGQYYIVVKNQGRNMQGSPFKINVVASPAIATVRIASGDGLQGGDASAQDTLKVTPVDSLGNAIETVDVTADLTAGLTVEVTNNNPAANVPIVQDFLVSAAAQPDGTLIPGLYAVTYRFTARSAGSTFTVVVKWNGEEIAREESFNAVGGANLVDTRVVYSQTTFEIVKPPVAGMTAGVVHMQMRDELGNPLISAPCNPTCEDIFEVNVDGPLAPGQVVRAGSPVAEGLTLKLTAIGGIVEGVLQINDAKFAEVAGEYTVTVTCIPGGGEDTPPALGNRCPSANAVATIVLDVAAADIEPASSTVVPVKGPYPVDPTPFGRTALAGELLQLRLVPRDPFGNDANFEDLDTRLKAKLTAQDTYEATTIEFGICAECDPSCVAGMLSRDPDGSYIVSYMLKVGGLYELSVEIDGIVVDGMPFAVNISPSTAVAFSSTTKDGHITGSAGQPLTIPLVFADEHGNSPAFPGGSVFVTLTHRDDASVVLIPPITSDTLVVGGLVTTSTFEKAGEYILEVQVADVDNALVSFWDQGKIEILPGQGVTGQVSQVQNGVATNLGPGGDGTLLQLAAGMLNELEVSTADIFGNAATGGSHVTAVLASVIPGVYSMKTVAEYNERDDGGYYMFKLDVVPSASDIPNDVQLRVYVDNVQIFLAKVDIAAPVTCAVSPTQARDGLGQMLDHDIVAAGQEITVDVTFENYSPALLADASIVVAFTSSSGDVVEGTAAAPVAGVVRVTTTLEKADVYSIAVLHEGDDELCESSTPFIAVVPAAPNAADTVLSTTVGTGTLTVGDSFGFTITSMDQYNNPIRVDPFNVLWQPITVTLVDQADGSIIECVQKAPGEPLPTIDTRYDIDDDGQPLLDDQCYVDSTEAGTAVISRPGSFAVVAVTADDQQIVGSAVPFTIEAMVVDPDWDIRKPRQYESYAGASQQITMSIMDRSTGIYITASHVAIAWLVNMEISASCCDICSCQNVARTPTVVTQSVDNEFRVTSSELHRTGTYAVQIEHATSGIMIDIPSVFTVTAGTPVGALYNLMTPWPTSVRAGATSEFTLMAKDVFANPVDRGGDLISANALYCTAQPNTNEAVTCLETAEAAYIAAGDVLDNDDGTYSVSYRPTLSGDYEVQVVRLGDGPIPHHPWRVTVEPGGVDPSSTTLDVTELLVNAAIDLQVQDAFGNLITENDPGVAFSYTWDFSEPHLDCGATGETCINRPLSSISANRNGAPNIGAAIDGEALMDSPVTWLTDLSDHTTVEVTIELETAGPIDRLRVVTFPDDAIEDEILSTGLNTVSISLYTSLDGIEWVAIEGLVDSYLGTEFLPEGTMIDPDGPSVGGAHIENLERYVPVWSVMFASRFAKYLRMDITAAVDNPSTKYPVREIQLHDCRCVHGAGNSGLIVYQEEFNAYKEVLFLQDATEPYSFDHAGVLTLSVMFGLSPIRYEPGFLGEPYVHLVGGSTAGDSAETTCLRFYADEVVVSCNEADYCTPGCWHSYNQWHSGEATNCNRFAEQDYQDIEHFCAHTAEFDGTSFFPSLVVPGDSPGIANGMLAGEEVVIEMLLSDPHGKNVAGTAQWLQSEQIEIEITGPSGVIPNNLHLTLQGAAVIEFTPMEVGEHSILVTRAEEPIVARLVMVDKGRAPAIVAAKFTSDGAAVKVMFDAAVSMGKGTVDCGQLLNSGSLLLLAGVGSAPVCNWFDTKTVTIILGYGASILPGDAIEILPGMIARVDVESSTAQGAIHVKHPDVGETPSFCLPDKIDLGNCESLNLRPSCQTGDGGRPLRFEYLVHRDHLDDNHLDTLSLATATTAVEQATGDLYLAPGTFVVSTEAAPVSTEFFVRATNFLGYSSVESSVVVTRSESERMPIGIDGDDEVLLDRDDYLFLQGRVVATEPDVNNPTCITLDDDVTFAWTQILDDDADGAAGGHGHVVDFEDGGEVDMGGGQEPYMYIRATTMKPGIKYKFQLSGTGAAGNAGVVSGSETVTVMVKERDLVPKIDGCDHLVNVNDAVSLDASGSFDPDSPERTLTSSLDADGSTSIETLFRWTCVTYPVGNPSSAGPCMEKSATSEAFSIAPQLQIPGGSMTVGNAYEFTVDITAHSLHSGIKTASTSVVIEPVDEDIPQIVIETPPFFRRMEDGGAYVTNANDQLVILANGDGDGTEFRWTFVEGGADLDGAWTSNRALTLPAGSLTAGQSCLLQVQGRRIGGVATDIGVASLRFVVGEVPSGGTVELSMDNLASLNRVGQNSVAGVSLVTDYTFTFTGWANAESYRIAYTDCSGVDEETGEGFCISDKFSMATRIPSVTTKLTSKFMAASTGTITVIAVVTDAYGSTNTFSLDIAIEPNDYVCEQLDATRPENNDLRLSQLGNYYQVATAEWSAGNCGTFGADEVQRQVRWAASATTGNESCVAEIQQHVRRSGWTQWGPWVSTFENGGQFVCEQTQTRVMFEKAIVSDQCVEEIQTRTRTNNQQWSPWTGPDGADPVNFEPTCSSASTREAWKRDAIGSGGELCQKAQQYQITIDNGDPLDWAGLYDTAGDDYTFDECVETETRIGYEEEAPTAGTEFERNACIEEVQTRQRSNTDAAAAGEDNLGGWSEWSGTITDCTETQNRFRYNEGYAAECLVETQTRTIQMTDETGWTPYSGTYNYLTCIVSPADPTTATSVQLYTTASTDPEDLQAPAQRANGNSGFVVTQVDERVRFVEPLAFFPDECVAETQTRTTGEDGEWGDWSGSFGYISCAQINVVDMYQVDRAETCVSQRGVRIKQCTEALCEVDWDPPVDAVTGDPVYSGDYTSDTCTVYEAQQTFTASGFDVPEDMSAFETNMYRCDALDQERDFDRETAEWSDWNAVSRPFAECDFEVSRVRWAAPLAAVGPNLPGAACVSEVQTRRPVMIDGERSWTVWSGTYRYEHCTERQTRYRYGISLGVGTTIPVGECTSSYTIERRWRTDQSAWFGDVFLTQATALANGAEASPYPYDDCARALPEQRVAFLEASPDAATGCLRQYQTRSRTDFWEAWDNGPDEDQLFSELLCIVEEERTRWRKLPDGCQSEVQSRYKDGNDDWSAWTGDFTEPTCTDTRIRYNNREIGAGYNFPPQCTGVINEGELDAYDCSETPQFVAAGNQTATNCPAACVFTDAVAPTCEFEEQTMTGAQDATGQPLIEWTGTYIYETCEDIQLVTKWLTPISWDGPCDSADRTRRRTALAVDLELQWDAFGAFSEPMEYIHDSCVQYQSRERFFAVDGDPGLDNVCTSETQIRSCVDCSEAGAGFNWSPWSGTYIYPLCIRSLALEGSGFRPEEDVQQRLQFQYQTGRCERNETQVRVRLPEDGQPGTEWTPWSGDFVYAFCPFTGTIEQRQAWIRASVASPEECISESQTRYSMAGGEWTAWFGDFSYTACTETQTTTFYQAAVVVNGPCIAAQQTRSRTNRGPFGDWSGLFVETECMEVQERVKWLAPEATDGEVCQNQVQNRTRAPDEDWEENWSGDAISYTSSSCVEIQERDRWEASSTAADCVSESQVRTRTDGGILTQWNGTFQFGTCQQNQERVRYDADVAPEGLRCTSEIQTRDRYNNGEWSDWSGDPEVFAFDSCVPGAPTVETRIRWRANSVVDDSCRSEVQQRTVSADNMDPPWGGTFNFSACTEVQERYRFAEAQATTCIYERQTRSAPGTSRSWGEWTGALVLENCTEVRYQWREANDAASECESEEQTRMVDEVRAYTDWGGSFNYTECRQLAHLLRWRESAVECASEQFFNERLRNPSTGNPSRDCGQCESETVTRSRPALPDGTSGAWSAWNGTVVGRPAFVFDACTEVDIRRRYQFPMRNASIDEATGEPSLTAQEHNLDNQQCMLASEAQTRSRTNEGVWSSWSGTPDFIDSECSNLGFESESRIRWYEPNTDNEPCLMETQVRNRNDWSGDVWGEWSGSYIYATCTEYATTTRYSTETTVNSPCRPSVARRQRTDGDAWSLWESEYNYTSCLQTEYRTAWEHAEILGSTQCRSEYQTRSLQLPDDGGTPGGEPVGFSPWQPDVGDHLALWAEPHCTQRETRMKWLSPTASTFSCEGELQNRTRTDNGEWSCWDGSYLFDSCLQTQRRKRYQTIAEEVCDEEVQERQAEGSGEFTAWSGQTEVNDDGVTVRVYDVEDCVQPGEQIETRDRYRDDGVCTYERHIRTRSNGGRWSDWIAELRDGTPVETLSAELESCVETESRFRYISIHNMCMLTESLRYREGSVSGEAGWIENPMGGC